MSYKYFYLLSGISLKGYKGTFINIVLMALTLYVDSRISPVSRSQADLNLPLNYLMLCGVLILFERNAILNILSVEFQQISIRQETVWQWFQKSWYFGILILMAVIWRTYFRIVLIIFPLLGHVYEIFDISYQTVFWPLKIPYWFIFGWIVIRELRLVADIIEPPVHHVPLIIEWISRAIQVVLMTVFLTNLTVLMNGYYNTSKGIYSGILQSIPFMLIVFTFFYIPIRWVDVLSDFIDLKSKWQTILFWVSTFILMITVIEPRITEDIIRLHF
ncbi:MAG: hypothetical protein IPJ51_17990 [Saprospiraceae bacterium]|nr:hypothetical protein [Saprospiraceae bacterium]